MVPFANDIEQCLLILKMGGLILYPTDTIWGIGCDATNAEAVAKIYALKQRAANKNMIILLSDEKDILTFTIYDLILFYAPMLRCFRRLFNLSNKTWCTYTHFNKIKNFTNKSQT